MGLLDAPALSASAGTRGWRPGGGYAVAIGDSRTASNGNGSPLRVVEGWFPQLCALSRQRIRYGGMFATAGYTLSQIRDTHLPSVLALNPRPSACFVFGGTNTEVSGLVKDGITVLDQIVTRLMAVGILPILVSELPRNDSTDPLMQQFNVAQRRYASRKGLPILDANLAMLVQTGSTAGQRNASLYGDNLHPTFPAGYGAIAARGITDSVPALFLPHRVTSKVDGNTVGDQFNLLTSGRGLFRTDSGTGLSTGWTASGTGSVTYSLVTPSGGDDLVGNWQRVVRGTGGATNTVYSTSISAAAGWAVGDTVAYAGRFKSTIGTGGTFTFQVQWSGATGTPNNLEALYSWTQSYSDGAFYCEAQIPAGTTQLLAQVALSPPTSGTSTLDVGELTLWNISSGAALLP